MESDGSTARDTLHELDTDRSVLARRICAPAWVHLGFAPVFAGFLVTPAFGDDALHISAPILPLAVLALSWYQYSVTGIRPKAIGVGLHAWSVVAVAAIAVPVLYSVSLGLVAEFSRWWALAPATAGFGVTWWATVAFERRTREHVRHGA